MSIARFLALPLVAAALANPARSQGAVETYISLGDSLAFGYTTFEAFAPSFADQGYVRHVADAIGGPSGVGRPAVVNLGISYETTATFTTGGLPATATNLNYSLSYPPPYPSQSTAFLAQAAARPVDLVSISLGSNDLFALAARPDFQASPDPFALLVQELGAIGGRYRGILGLVRSVAPEAEILLLSSYNPYAALPESPLALTAGVAIPMLNQVIAGLATEFDARYVDVYSAFLGHEAEYTHILSIDTFTQQPNVHPTDLGYRVMADRMLAASNLVPEPGAFLLAGMGLIGMAGMLRRRRFGASA